MPARATISTSSPAAWMPSLPGMWPRTVRPPEDSPPITASVSAIFALIHLKPTGTSWHSWPCASATRSSRWVVDMFRTTGPVQPFPVSRYSYSSTSTWSGLM